jgi:acyl carrier protein
MASAAAVLMIWCEVFGTTPESVDDRENFFAAGGTSLQAVRLRTALREAFGVDIDLQTIYAEGTVAELAELVDRGLLAELDAISDEAAARLLAQAQSYLGDETDHR